MRAKDIISSSSNNQVKQIALLMKKAKARDEQGVYVVEGIKMFEEAITEGVLVKAYFSESYYKNRMEEIHGYGETLSYEILSDSIFGQISETMTPQGVLGIVRMKSYDISELIKGKNPSILMLEDIRDPGNLGTMIRTAEGAGISGIILNQTSVDVYNPKVIRSTMGSIYRLPVIVAEDFQATIRQMKEEGIEIFAGHLSGKLYDSENGFLGKCAILIGNEANGLSDEVSQLADSRIRIPMAGKVESLNAAVAAAVLMYEISRQRSKI